LGGGPTTTYAGAGVGYDPGASRLFPNVVLGANLPLAGALGAFGEFGWRVGVGGVTRFGLTFAF
ncbi:hypothetical protein, partial [Deinococcus pimensis]|uniref:hypothetical protein n=1 Tax=Deinococcus pimensis TaxID=309888 RepID=UPI0005EBB9C7